LAWLAERQDISRIDWQVLSPNAWLELETDREFNEMLPLGTMN